MAPHRRYRTIRDLDAFENDTTDNHISSSSGNNSKHPSMSIHHITDLPDAHKALELLQRLHKEFFPLAQRRGYKVLSLSEMCCCGDGWFAGAGKPGRKNKKGKQGKIMQRNVLGYNQTYGSYKGGGTHRIHIRLRQSHHVFYPWEDIAGTMSHELAHCRVGPHNAKFYKLMDEIQEQHAVFLCKGIVADTQGFPMGSTQAHVLGRGTANTNNTGGSAGKAAIQRQQTKIPKWMFSPQKLGGDSSLAKLMPAGQAAAMAAETRRFLDDQWCQPCNNDDEEEYESDDVIEIIDPPPQERLTATVANDGYPNTGTKRRGELKRDHGENNNDDIDDNNRRKKPAEPSSRSDSKRKSGTNTVVVAAGSTTNETIDLTSDNEEGVDIGTTPVRVAPVATTSAKASSKEWACIHCTFVNSYPALACSLCGTEKESTSAQILQQITKDDVIDQIKRNEVEQSVQTFDGFNIYGTTEQKSSQMDHIT